MKISVIIPTYNRAHVLSRAIKSVLNQTYKDIEIVVVDDGSTDETWKILEEYPSIRTIQTENRGVSAARNTGVEKSNGEWIAFLDSDDEWLPHKLETQVSMIEKSPEISLFHGEEIWIRNGKRINQKKIHRKSGGKIFKRALHLCLISPSAVIMRRSLLEECGGFCSNMTVCEDYDLWLKVTYKYEIGFCEDPLIIKYGGHEDQLSAKYKAMDYYRVLSMENMLLNYDLTEEDKLELLHVLEKKCDILLNGYEKHGNVERYSEISKVKQRHFSA